MNLYLPDFEFNILLQKKIQCSSKITSVFTQKLEQILKPYTMNADPVN